MNASPLAAAAPSERQALGFLAELSESLAVSLDLRETLDMAVTRIAGFMRAEAASLFNPQLLARRLAAPRSARVRPAGRNVRA